MWTHRYTTQTDMSPDDLWPLLANVNGWADIDRNIEKVVLDGAPQAGAVFHLKPRGGPNLMFRIGVFEPPCRYSDICKLFLAEMETVHSLKRVSPRTTIDVAIEIRGPMSWFWGLTLGVKHAAGLPAQTERLIAAARRM